MKFWTIAALLTSALIVSLVVRKKMQPVTVDKDSNRRYNIDDFLDDQAL
ncbi:MAG: hypothetical protein HYR76_07370 [Ignavibacteria bacterium]|nr:hypothetical protein [Ignavibacteria bacterium]MBI3766189.1 hypothetical protein [Ignavibacteriales bacterium]